MSNTEKHIDLIERMMIDYGKTTINKKPVFPALLAAKRALKKQIPQPLTYEGDGYDDEGKLIYDTAYCPNCENQFEVDYCGNPKHCPECGQALDWNTAEESEGTLK